MTRWLEGAPCVTHHLAIGSLRQSPVHHQGFSTLNRSDRGDRPPRLLWRYGDFDAAAVVDFFNPRLGYIEPLIDKGRIEATLVESQATGSDDFDLCKCLG